MIETVLLALTVVLTIVLIYYSQEQHRSRERHINLLQGILDELRGKESYAPNNTPLLMHSQALGSVCAPGYTPLSPLGTCVRSV